MNNTNINKKLESLSKSKFRSSFHLNSKLKLYIKENGLAKIEKHAYEIINERIKPAFPKNDGKQTPMKKVHPVFIAQHACGCCCRSCIEKWHHIPKGIELNTQQVNYIVMLLMEWIKKEYLDV